MPVLTPVKLFFCYAPEDEALRSELEKHLTLLARQGYIASWSGHSIGASGDFRSEVERQMNEARAILLLVSADFLASDHLYEVELDRALARASAGAIVRGVLLRPCDWEHGKLRLLEGMLPRDAAKRLVPVTEWSSHDAAFASVSQELRAQLKDWGYVTGSSIAGRISVNPSEAHPQ